MAQDIIDRAKAANFDERLSLLGMLLDGVSESMHEVSIDEKVFEAFFDFLKQKKTAFSVPGAVPAEILNGQIQTNDAAIATGKKSGSQSVEDQTVLYRLNEILRQKSADISLAGITGSGAFAKLREDFEALRKEVKKKASEAGKQMSNAFIFSEKAFGDESQEILILVTELTANPLTAKFISRYGCKEYFAHNKELLFYERQKEIISRMEDLEL